MHRLILNSAAYRQSSMEIEPKVVEADPDDHLSVALSTGYDWKARQFA